MADNKARYVPGEGTLRTSSVGNAVCCSIHGYKFTPGEVICDGLLKPVCLQCFEVGTGDLPASGVSDPLCANSSCMAVAAGNHCRLCNKRYCDIHMFSAGTNGLCNSCMDTGRKEVARQMVYHDQLCSQPHCNDYGVVECKGCELAYCGSHVDAESGMCPECKQQLGHMQAICTGDDDFDSEGQYNDTCEDCDGDGAIDGEICKTCNGTGKL